MYSTTDFKKGLKIEVEKIPYEIVDFQHFKPGKGGAMVRTKLRNILTGRTQDITFRSGEKVERPDLEVRDMQFLYKEGEDLIFMDLTSYEQLHISGDALGDKKGYLLESQIVPVLLYQGKAIDLELAASAVFTVIETEPGVKGDTVSNTSKPATLETGIIVQVPLFINIGDTIKVDTRSGVYLGRE